MAYYTPTFPTAPTYGGGYQPQYMPQQRMVVPPQTTAGGYICRPVASEEEARAIPTDFTGATLLLVDAAHNRIYVKSLNMYDGTARFTTYCSPDEPEAPKEAPKEAYAPLGAVEELRAEIEKLKAAINKEDKDGKSNANDAVYAGRRKSGGHAPADDGQ